MRTVLLIATALLLAGCGDETDDGSGTRSGPELDGRTFVATAIEDSGAIRHLAEGTELRLTFDDGKLGINAGCNHMSGDYTLAGDRMTVGDMSTTEMGCEPQLMAQDVWVSGVFAEPVTFSLTGGDLRLTSGNAELLFTDREVVSPDASLTGTTWVLDALIDGEAVSSVPEGVVASLLIEDGMARIDTACNAVTADVAVGGGTITFSNAVTTDVGCSGARSRVEQAVTAVLQGTVTWSINEHSLTVTRGSDGLGFRVA